jgi:hypothetical protein
VSGRASVDSMGFRATIFVGPEADENNYIFVGPEADENNYSIFMGLPTKIFPGPRKYVTFSSVQRPTKITFEFS